MEVYPGGGKVFVASKSISRRWELSCGECVQRNKCNDTISI
jgi:hypothetical protein